MSNKEEFEFFVEQLLDNAIQEFKSTEQYRLLREKLDQMDRDCDTMLTEDEREFVMECFELMLEVSGQQELYVFRKGMLGSVKILKWLNILA